MAAWSSAARHAALAWFARRAGATVFTDVLVSRASWRGWPRDAKRHRIDVAIAPGSPALMPGDESLLDERVSVGVVRPLVALGYADRPVLGRLVVTSAMLARSYPEHGLIHPAVLVSTDNAEPNTRSAYLARGCEIIVVPDDMLT
jgi:hypothetical protein